MNAQLLNATPGSVFTLAALLFAASSPRPAHAFVIVDSGQEDAYDVGDVIDPPAEGEAYYGQDRHYFSHPPRLQDNGDGTVSDLTTGLMWQQDPGDKMTYDEAVAAVASFDLAGHTDWRLPTIKELYSLMRFDGEDPSGYEGNDTSGLVPFIDDDVFVFNYGDTDQGERIIDAQYLSSTQYVGDNAWGMVFGVNFADGRIKGYDSDPSPHQPDGKDFFVIYVRGDAGYGENDFVVNGDGTVTDDASGLEWMQVDSGYFGVGEAGDGALTWPEALDWAEDLEFAGHSDWRLPSAKELQSLVDYTRAPSETGSAAIDPSFQVTSITDEAGDANFPFYWSGTTHANWQGGGHNAAYIAFGEALGYVGGRWTDVHGAGAQRSDPKVGDPDDYPYGHGPQGDAIRIYNHVRLVRDGLAVTPVPDVKVNGADGSVLVPEGDPVTVTVSMEANDFDRARADLWVIATAPSGPFSYVYPANWVSGVERAVAMPLQSIGAMTLYDASLPVGSYELQMAIDHDADGELDATWLDTVDITIGNGVNAEHGDSAVR